MFLKKIKARYIIDFITDIGLFLIELLFKLLLSLRD